MTKAKAGSEAHQDLYNRIWAHPFEHPDQASDLVRRLHIEQRWSMQHARDAIEEYRRFCFLACTASHSVTPSDQVDAVWHLHLLHTRDYWDTFCPHVLRYSLHHGPTEGGKDQQHLFYEQYAQTLHAYSTVFGPPPEAWWPAARNRFQPVDRWQWVYRPTHWVIPNPMSWCKQQINALTQRFIQKGAV